MGVPSQEAMSGPIRFPSPADPGLRDEPPRCRGCGYNLSGLARPICPECGQPFNPDQPQTYDRRPPFLFWRYWLPALVLSLLTGLVLCSLFIASGNFGFGLVLATPLVFGVILGYGVRQRAGLKAVLVFFALVGLILSLVGGPLVGVFCGAILCALFTGPLMIGVGLGYALRQYMKHRQHYPQRHWLPVLLLCLLPLGVAGLERAFLPHRFPIERAVTRKELPISVRSAFRRFAFFEAQPTPPPGLARLLPSPTGWRGRVDRLGAVSTCYFANGGRFSRRITRYQPGRAIAFTVLEQYKLEDRAGRLLGGSIRFEPLGQNRCWVTLVSVYEPKLQARLFWRPWEHATAHSIHAHVIRGMLEDRPTGHDRAAYHRHGFLRPWGIPWRLPPQPRPIPTGRASVALGGGNAGGADPGQGALPSP
jgi:hypothetical protein